MIDQAVDFVKEILNSFLRNKFSLDENAAVINVLVDPDGSIPQENQNKVVISLINLEEVTQKPFRQSNARLQDGNYAKQVPNSQYNLELLFTSNFDDYQESLKFLNAAIVFYQSNPVITSDTFSNMPHGIDKLMFELVKLDYQQMQNLWNAMGANYQPSVIYKLRMITINSENTAPFMTSISASKNELS